MFPSPLLIFHYIWRCKKRTEMQFFQLISSLLIKMEKKKPISNYYFQYNFNLHGVAQLQAAQDLGLLAYWKLKNLTLLKNNPTSNLPK